MFMFLIQSKISFVLDLGKHIVDRSGKRAQLDLLRVRDIAFA